MKIRKTILILLLLIEISIHITTDTQLLQTIDDKANTFLDNTFNP